MKKFQINSGKVNLTDPCYDISTWCGSYGMPAKNGEWQVKIRHDQGRVSGWVAYHQDHQRASTYDLSIEFGVDSGQFGIFDASTYVGDTDDDGRKWYFGICDITCDSDRSGITPDGLGFVSSTGWGDGSYVGQGAFDEYGNLVKFVIDFMEDECDDDEYDDE